MKIALLAPQSHQRASALGVPGGQRVASLAGALAKLGNHVTIYARSEFSATLPSGPGIAVERLPAGVDGEGDLGARVRALSERLAERWQAAPPEIAHAWSWTDGLAALAGARGLGVPVVQTVNAIGAEPGMTRRQGAGAKQARISGGSDALIRMEVSLARCVNGVLATSSQAMRQLAGYGVPRTAIRVVPWGVDVARFAPEGPVARRSKRSRLLTVVPLCGARGVAAVVRALAEVPEAELVIAGVPATGGEREALGQLGADAGVADRVRLLGGVAPRDMPALLRSADLLVSAGWDELYSTVELQAMACATPVVAFSTGFNGDAVIDGTTGMLVPPGDPSALARRVRGLLASPLRLEAFGIAAADRARARYSWERIGEETLRAYQGCLPSQPEEADLEEVA